MKYFKYDFLILENKTGITLIEVLIAIVILTIGILGIAILQYMAIGGNAFGREMQIATNLAQGFLEITRSTTFRDASKNINPIFQEGKHPTQLDIAFNPVLQNPAGSGEPNYESRTRSGGTIFTRIWWVVNNCRDLTIDDPDPDTPVCNPPPTANCVSGASMDNISAISVRVCWVDKNGGNHSVTLNGIKWDETATP
ncbi:MAG: prepilin-type N-terminal cleavage/methylation domain-containing protein [Nitrospirae bacterium]|nr:prepilin-type N-terminal cleavage/methylation domain-containing protein [Nitrospirota bacterium]